MQAMDYQAGGAVWLPDPIWVSIKEPELKLSLKISTYGDLIVIHCKGRVVYRDEAAAFFAQIAKILPQTRDLILEFSGVQMLDGAGLGELAVLLKRARAAGCRLRLAAPAERVAELLKLTKLDSAFEIYPTLEAALSAVRKSVSNPYATTQDELRSCAGAS